MISLEIVLTCLLGSLFFWWGIRFGKFLLRRGATANDLFKGFKGKSAVSLAFVGLYFALAVFALYVPQLQTFPIEMRVYGMRITWTILRVTLIGFCGLAFIISWRTARIQVIAVLLLGLLGLGSFTWTEGYFLSPIHASLVDNLRPNGVFRQTSGSSCAPAALATVLRRWNMEATESEMARLAGTSRLGTSMPQLIVALHELGMDGLELAPTWEQMRQINRPGVLATWLISSAGKAPHAVALLGLNETTAMVADPAFGDIFEMPRSRFERIWRQEYVPIFRPEEIVLAPGKAADYLVELGYLNQPDADLTEGVRRFQKAMGSQATGKLDAKTVLLLTGSFLSDVPTLDMSISGIPLPAS